MKKRFRIISIVATLLVICLIAGSLITVTQSRETRIKANFFNVLQELNSPANWKNWQASLKAAYSKNPSLYKVTQDSAAHSFFIKGGTRDFYVKKISPVSFEVKEITNNDTLLYTLNVLSTLLPDYTNVVTTTRVNLLRHLLSGSGKDEAFSTATHLKSFIEDPLSYYGYPLTVEKTIDTVVVVTNAVAASKNWRPTLSAMYQSLSRFIEAHHLRIMQPKIVSFKAFSKDSVELRAGIPVNKVAPDSGEVKCLKMPKGNMLVGQYTGAYDQRNSLSTSMEKYIRNHSLDEIAVPYEKYLNNTIPQSDTSRVTIKMYYPILD